MSSQNIDNKTLFNNWVSWRNDSVKLSKGKMLKAKSQAEEIGLLAGVDFIARSNAIRFANPTSLTFFKLNWRPNEL
tara:strand:- start:1205 stop:1432 length:228 start_codon:yes stop_codon:yes gene_type:complete